MLDRLIDANLTNFKSDSAKLQIFSFQEKREVNCGFVDGIHEGLKLILGTLSEVKKIDLSFISHIGHRFVHGGPDFSASIVIDESVLQKLESLDELAPLHNAACLEGIRESMRYFGSNVKQIAVFDTAFYTSLPPVSANYAIPFNLKGKYGIKRYGFHGIAHSYLWIWYKSHVEKKNSGSKIITLHLGNGCSITATHDGKPVDTSMGFTPAEGLIMATRAGDIDAGVIEYLCKREGKKVEEILHVLNYKSGLLGISERSSRMDTLLNEYHVNDQSKLAVDMFCYRALKYLGAYLSILGGADCIIFSGGIGENSPEIRNRIIMGLDWFGAEIDEESNEQAVDIQPGESHLVSTQASRVPVYAIGVDENLSIAQSIKQHFVL